MPRLTNTPRRTPAGSPLTAVWTREHRSGGVRLLTKPSDSLVPAVMRMRRWLVWTVLAGPTAQTAEQTPSVPEERLPSRPNRRPNR